MRRKKNYATAEGVECAVTLSSQNEACLMDGKGVQPLRRRSCHWRWACPERVDDVEWSYSPLKDLQLPFDTWLVLNNDFLSLRRLSTTASIASVGAARNSEWVVLLRLMSDLAWPCATSILESRSRGCTRPIGRAGRSSESSSELSGRRRGLSHFRCTQIDCRVAQLPLPFENVLTISSHTPRNAGKHCKYSPMLKSLSRSRSGCLGACSTSLFRIGRARPQLQTQLDPFPASLSFHKWKHCLLGIRCWRHAPTATLL
ncbi:hypothetical protein B0H19DRAFT_217031 [Mycena capillaripes]|nr:hypothetical protein B0H19DRAFT_217031 [Mycena capillaripes]